MPIARRGVTGHVEPGEYLVRIVNVSEAVTKFGDGFRFTFEILEGEEKSATLQDTHPVEFTRRNKLGRLLLACGYDPDKLIEFNLNKLLDEQLIIRVEDAETERGTFSRIKEYLPAKITLSGKEVEE